MKNVSKTFRNQYFCCSSSADYQEAVARGWKRQIFTEPSSKQTIRVEQ